MTWQRARIEELTRRFLIPEDSADPKELKRRRLVASASELFAHHGYRKTSIDDIARGARVAKGTVYLYFESKADLLLHALVAEKTAHMGVFLELLDGPLDARERLRGFLRLSFTLIHQMPLTSRVTQPDMEIAQVLEELDPGFVATLEAGQRATYRSFLEPFAAEQGWSEADLVDRAATLVSVLYLAAPIGDQGLRVGLSIARHAELMADALVDGFAGPLRSAPIEQG